MLIIYSVLFGLTCRTVRKSLMNFASLIEEWQEMLSPCPYRLSTTISFIFTMPYERRNLLRLPRLPVSASNSSVAPPAAPSIILWLLERLLPSSEK